MNRCPVSFFSFVFLLITLAFARETNVLKKFVKAAEFRDRNISAAAGYVILRDASDSKEKSAGITLRADRQTGSRFI